MEFDDKELGVIKKYMKFAENNFYFSQKQWEDFLPVAKRLGVIN